MTKHALEKKESKILNANNRTISHNGQVYLIRCQSLGKLVLADAEPLPKGGTTINLFGRGKLSTELRNKVEIGLFS